MKRKKGLRDRMKEKRGLGGEGKVGNVGD